MLARVMLGYPDFGVNQPEMNDAIPKLAPLAQRGNTAEEQAAKALTELYAQPQRFADAMLEYWLKGTISDPVVRDIVAQRGYQLPPTR